MLYTRWFKLLNLIVTSDSACSSSPAFLRFRNANVARGDDIVLHDINLDIASGEHVAILGPNGCGKSTLIKAMTCELYPIVREGLEVSIFGKRNWNLVELRPHLGIVSQDMASEHTPLVLGFEAVVAGFFSASKLWPNLHVTDEMKERAHEALQRMEATHLADKLVGEMSAGEKRRIQIARALVHRPEMLLLDEPSNALDFASQRELRDILRGLAQQGTGLILITHHLPDVLPEISRVILMTSGRIIADGHRDDLLTGPSLEKVFKVPVSIAEHEGYLHCW